MNDREVLAKLDYRLQLVEKNQGQFEQAFQIVWAWLISNKAFCDKLPFSTIKPKEEEKPAEPVVEVKPDDKPAPTV